jgi:segregation and condensation protein A
MAPTTQASYRVTLPIFEGPLDLLLHLIERQELDITQVSLARVTNQYLEHLAQLSQRDPDNLADFLLVAAKLLLIKSRFLLPAPARPAVQEEEGEGEELVRQLIEYKKLKQAAGWLRALDERGLQSYLRLASSPHLGGGLLERSVDLDGVELDHLLAAMRQVLALKPPSPSVNAAVTPVTITVAEQMERIEAETTKRARVSFLKLLHEAANRLEVIVTLLALLEMVKQGRVTMRQSKPFGDILIARGAPESV